MSDVEATLGEVCTLIGRFAGFLAVHGSIEGEDAVIHLTAERGALSALQDIFLAANADITPWLRDADESPGAIASQTVRASVSRRDGLIAHGSLQLAGIHAVWRLHRYGLMSASEANGYLLRWRAVPVPLPE